MIEKIEKQSLSQFLFSDLLGTFRLSSGKRAESLGFEAMRLLYHIDNPDFGPTPRLNLVGYTNFGFLGNIVLSMISGFVFTFIRNNFLNAYKHSLSKVFLYYFLYSQITSIEEDISSTIVSFTTNMFINLFALVIIGILFYKRRCKTIGSNQCIISYV